MNRTGLFDVFWSGAEEVADAKWSVQVVERWLKGGRLSDCTLLYWKECPLPFPCVRSPVCSTERVQAARGAVSGLIGGTFGLGDLTSVHPNEC